MYTVGCLAVRPKEVQVIALAQVARSGLDHCKKLHNETHNMVRVEKEGHETVTTVRLSAQRASCWRPQYTLTRSHEQTRTTGSAATGLNCVELTLRRIVLILRPAHEVDRCMCRGNLGKGYKPSFSTPLRCRLNKKEHEAYRDYLVVQLKYIQARARVVTEH